jgi:glycosyltransferase involved in cell wall biosynthesis
LKGNHKKLSALIITLNEEDRIEKLISNLNFADEIVIVDSYSTDNTVAIIKRHTEVKLIQHHFENFSKQRNFALKQVKNDWVLFIDADEIIPNNLKLEILNKLKNPNGCIAFKTFRQFYFKDKPLNYSGWQTDKVYRLFNRKNVSFEPTKFVHETLNVDGKTETLKEKLIHFSYNNYNDYKEKMEHYAILRARELYAKKLKPNLYHFYIKPLYRFFNHYIIRLGFLDGKNGYIICKLNAYGVKQRYVALKKLNS